MSHLKNKERLRFVYHPPKQLGEDADIYKCSGCEGDVFEVHEKDGVGKLPRDQIKMKCCNCGLWFITNKARIERVLGEV